LRKSVREQIDGAVQMRHEFDHAANDSPRSGSSKQATPVAWAVVVVVVVAVAIWLATKS
jgi:hypothetical protein